MASHCCSQAFLGVTPSPGSRTWFPSSRRLRLRAVLGSAYTLGTARCRARHRRMPVRGSTASLPKQGCLCDEEAEIPMTPPSPYRERVVGLATLQSAVSCVTVTTLWLAARGSVGWPPPHCREGFRHGSASGPRACFPSHRPTPGRVPHLERSTYALLGAPSSKPCSTAISMSCFRRVCTWDSLCLVCAGTRSGRGVLPARDWSP